MSASRSLSVANPDPIIQEFTEMLVRNNLDHSWTPPTVPRTQYPEDIDSPLQMLTYDELDLMVLDPVWLEQYPPSKHEEVFFHSILPRLVRRIDDCAPDWKYKVDPLTLPANLWVATFHEKVFHLEKVFSEYNNEFRVANLAALNEYMILERAKVMCERLWAQCREFYLLGLAYFSMGSMDNSKEMKVDVASSELTAYDKSLSMVLWAPNQVFAAAADTEFLSLSEEEVLSSRNFW